MFRWLLYPLTIIYQIVVSLRNFLYDYNIIKSKKFDKPVISIGNITVGGTGKTPHIEYLIDLLKDKYKIATLSRGYKRKTRGFILSSSESTINEIGDEPKQMKLKYPAIDVSVDSNRVRGITKLLLHNQDYDAILLDDAYQHRKVKPGLSILLIDYNRPLDKDYLLPYGRLREKHNEKRRADIIIVTKAPKNLKPIDFRITTKHLKLFPYQKLFFSSIDYGILIPLYNKPKANKLNGAICKENNYTILLVSGIANPEPLKIYLEENYSSKIEQLVFPDHHNFTKGSIRKINQKFNSINNNKKIIITTEKDAMRLMYIDYMHDSIKNFIYYIPISIQFLNNEKEHFNNQIIDYVEENKRDYKFYKTKYKEHS